MESNIIPEYELNRKRNLQCKDLESLQEQFMKERKDNKTKLSVTMRKEKKIEIDILNNFNQNKDINECTIERKIEKSEKVKLTSTKEKKKKKDIIQMDLNIFNLNDSFKKSDNLIENKNNNQYSKTIFSEKISLEKSNNHNFSLKEIDIKTGLPKIPELISNSELKIGILHFKENYKIKENIKLNSTDKENYLDSNAKEDISNENIKITQKNFLINLGSNSIKDQEYKVIHDKNMELIKTMSKEEMFNNLESIKANIPKELLEKMKTGFFQKKLSEDYKNLEREKLIESIKKEEEYESEEENQSEEEHPKKIEQIINNKEKNYTSKDLFNNLNLEQKKDLKEIFVFNIEGTCKLISTEDPEFLTINENLDYINMKFESYDFSKKVFTFNEISNLIQSTSDNLILIGLKVIYNLLNKNLEIIFENKKNNLEKERIKFNQNTCYNYYCFEIIKFFEEKNVLYMLFYLIEHKNINIRLNSIKNFCLFTNFFFKQSYKNMSTNLFYNPSFPIIKPDIINITNDSFDSNINFLHFKNTFLNFNYFRKFYDENFLRNFYLIKTAFENYSAIIRMEINKSDSIDVKYTNNKIPNFADENLLLEYLDFLKLNIYYSDHFIMKFVNSELITQLDEIIIQLSYKFNTLNQKVLIRLNSIIIKIYILTCLSNFDIEFINSKTIKFTNELAKSNSYDNTNEINKNNLLLKIIKIHSYFKCLKEPFFENEFKFFLSNFDPKSKYDILVLNKLVNESNIEKISSFFSSGIYKSNKLDFNSEIEYLLNKESTNDSFLKDLKKLIIKIKLNLKIKKYLIKAQLENMLIFKFESQVTNFGKLIDFANEKFFSVIENFLLEKYDLYCFSNVDLYFINNFLIFFNLLIRMKILLDKFPKFSNFLKVFEEKSFFNNIEKINYIILSIARRVKYQTFYFEKLKVKTKGIKNYYNNINNNNNKSNSIYKNSDKNKEYDIQDHRIRLLSQLENFLDFFLNFLKLKALQDEKLLIKNQFNSDHFNPRFNEFISEIPNFVNVFSECKYFKFTKYFEKLIFFKFLYFQKLSKSGNKDVSLIFNENKIKNYEQVFDRISDSLKVFLNSNEDLRKSFQTKNVFQLIETLNKDYIYFNEFNKSQKSKYFPLVENNINKNFLILTFTNPKLESELKLNFLFVYLINFYNVIDNKTNKNIEETSKIKNKIENYFSINNFNILLKTILNFSDKAFKNIAEILFDEFIRCFVFIPYLNDLCFREKNNFSFKIFKDKIKKNYDNEIDFELFYMKFDDIYNDEVQELNLYYKFVIILIIYFNSYDYLNKKNHLMKKKLLSIKEDSKNLEEINLLVSKVGENHNIFEQNFKNGSYGHRLLNLNNLVNLISTKFYLLLDYTYYDNLKFLPFDIEFNTSDDYNLIHYLTHNLNFSNFDFYECLILQFIKYFSFDKISLSNKNTCDDKILTESNNQIIDLFAEIKGFSLKKEKFFQKNFIYDFTIELMRTFDLIRVEENIIDSQSKKVYLIILNVPCDYTKNNFNKETEFDNTFFDVIELKHLLAIIAQDIKKIIKEKIYMFFTKRQEKS